MSNAIVPGSLQAIAQSSGASIAETFINAETIIVVDVSGSMTIQDVTSASWETGLQKGPSRYDRACQELADLQADLPGKIAVVAFSSAVEFCPSGRPVFQGGGTDLAAALKFVHVADECDIRFIVISDGEPDDEARALKAARKFRSKIDTIFVGPAGGAGQDFLRRLANASGGQNITANQVKDLSKNVQKLLVGAP